MPRPWIQVLIGLVLSLGAVALCEAHRRLDRLEHAPRIDPTIVSSLRKEVRKIESKVAESLAQIDKLRTNGEHTAELDRRLNTLEVELTEAASTLASQRTKIELFDDLQDKSERLEDFRKGSEQTWAELESVAREAMGLAKSTHQNLVEVETNLTRDERRMWQDLVGPIVQLMGDETVGSGVLLRSRNVEGTDKYETYLLTAWHVVRDIQAGPDNLHKPVPVTVYGEDGRIWPETAELLKYDAAIDVAMLRLNTTRKLECGAKLASRATLHETKIFEQVYAVGCPLGNDPIPTFGEIADTHHLVDGVRYWMISAPTYIGNSGGGIFDARTHELLGIFSKIYTHGSMRPTVVPHMGLVTSLEAVYDWMDKVGLADLEPDAPDAQVASVGR